MNAARLFIERPVAASLMAIAIILLGLLGYRSLPMAPLPDLDFPAIQVMASLPGANPETMATNVATPLERALGAIPGVSAINSNSGQGNANIWVEFYPGRDLNEAAREVQAAINSAISQLPSGMPRPPSFRKISPSQAPIMALAVSSSTRAPSELYDISSTLVAQTIAAVNGVAQVGVEGSSLPAIRVQINPLVLTRLNIAIDEVRTAISNANPIKPLGLVEENDTRWLITRSQDLVTAADYRELIIRTTENGVVRLGDVAEVFESTESRFASGYHNENPAILLFVNRQSGANIAATIEAINLTLPRLRQLIPDDVELKVVMDRSRNIRASLAAAQSTLVISALLVVGVVFLFLGNLRTALIPSVSIPIAIIGTFAIMYVAGFSLNNLSLMALIVATGLVVDDAIVVLENIKRHHDAGLPLHEAAVKGAKEVGATLIAMNVALMALFVSILFTGGMVEKLFKEFSLTLIAAMGISLVVALSLTPSLCARGLPKLKEPKPTPFFTEVFNTYSRWLDFALDHRKLIILLLLGVIGVNAYLYVKVPRIMLPEQDNGQLGGFIRGDDGFSFQIMQPKINALRDYLLQDPGVEDVFGAAGGGNGLSNAWVRVNLKTDGEPRETAQQVVDRIRRNIPTIAGARLMIGPDQDIRLSSPGSNSNYEVMLLSDDTQRLREWGVKLTDVMMEMDEITEVNGIRPGGTQQVELVLDREKAQTLGVDMNLVASLLNNAFSQRQVATLYEDINQYRVVMELATNFTETPQILDELKVLTRDGRAVPLSLIAHVEYGVAPDRIRRSNQFASANIGYAPAEGVLPEEARAAIEAKVAEIMLPADVFLAPPGGARSGWGPSQPGATLGPVAIGFAVALAMFLILGVLYESLLHPLTILSTLPSAGVGALIALQLSDTPFSLIALLGLFLLIGVVMKNAILMIDFALVRERDGMSARDAIYEAARIRLRPILMTNLAGLLGAVPLIVSMSHGAELRQPLGIAIIGGLAISQVLTLFTTPVVYLCLANLKARFTQEKSQSMTPREI